jgi:hypothetical protein
MQLYFGDFLEAEEAEHPCTETAMEDRNVNDNREERSSSGGS